MEEEKLLRLNKAISETGFCSRREADKYIEDGRVMINGKLGVLGDKVTSKDVIKIDGKRINHKQEAVYIAFHKPVGITCTTEPHIKGNIIKFINHPKRIFPIGRLDKPSEGLIFLTSDGDIVNKILRAGNNHEKEYIVRVNKPITPEFIDHMRTGVELSDATTKPCKCERINPYVFRIILTQGLNRQIRRMCDVLGYEVVKLKRIRIMHVMLDGIEEGQWRNLTERELEKLMELVENSSGTEEASFDD